MVKILVDAGLRIRIALHADSLARALAGTGVGLGALAADRQTAHMADATVAFDALQALEVHAEFAAEIALDHILAFLDGVNDLRKLGLSEVLGADRRINVRALEDDLRVNGADAVDVAQRNVNALVRRNFNTNDTCHKSINLAVACDVCSSK